LWEGLQDSGSAPRSTDLTGLRDAVVAEFERHASVFHGAGVAVAAGSLADCPHFLEWWRPGAKSGGPPRRLNLDLNPDSEYFYDYTTMQWYVEPRDRGTACVYGPYLDFTGVDLYVCTFAVPATSATGTFLGVAGADVPISRIETALLPTITACTQPLALINAEGRVIVANHADHVSGSKIRSAGHGPAWSVPDTPWSLVTLPTA
jgi:hypothetical protein